MSSGPVGAESAPIYSVAPCDEHFEFLVTTTSTQTVRDGKKVNVKSVKKRKVGIGKAQAYIDELQRGSGETQGDDKENVGGNLLPSQPEKRGGVAAVAIDQTEKENHVGVKKVVTDKKPAMVSLVPEDSAKKSKKEIEHVGKLVKDKVERLKEKPVSVVQKPDISAQQPVTKAMAEIQKPVPTKTSSRESSQQNLNPNKPHAIASKNTLSSSITTESSIQKPSKIRQPKQSLSEQIDRFAANWSFSATDQTNLPPVEPSAQYKQGRRLLNNQRNVLTHLIHCFKASNGEQVPQSACAVTAAQHMSKKQEQEGNLQLYLKKCVGGLRFSAPQVQQQLSSQARHSVEPTRPSKERKNEVFKDCTHQSQFFRVWPCCVPFTEQQALQHCTGDEQGLHEELQRCKEQGLLLETLKLQSNEIQFCLHDVSSSASLNKQEEHQQIEQINCSNDNHLIDWSMSIECTIPPPPGTSMQAWMQTLSQPTNSTKQKKLPYEKLKKELEYKSSKISKKMPSDTDVMRLQDTYKVFTDWKSKSRLVLEELLDSGYYDEQISTMMRSDSRIDSKLSALLQVLNIDKKLL